MTEPLGICNLLIVALTVYVSYRAFQDPALEDRLIFEPVRILRDKEYHRLFSSALLHGDWIHLIFNMFSLYSFGAQIEELFGSGQFLLIYLTSILGGNLLSLYLHRFHDYRALGASGGVCGVIFTSIFLLPGGEIMMMLIPFGIPAWFYALFFVIVSFIGMRTQAGNIGHDAHLGGALIGLLVTTALHPGIIRLSPLLYASVIGLSILLFLYAYLNPAYLQTHSTFSRAYWTEVGDKVQARREQKQARKQERDEQVLDQLLEKISQQGIESLSKAERQKLEQISRSKQDN